MNEPRTSKELLPCPFCAGAGRLINSAGCWFVTCDDCDADTGWRESSEDATALWNARASVEPAAGPVACEYDHEAMAAARRNYCHECGEALTSDRPAPPPSDVQRNAERYQFLRQRLLGFSLTTGRLDSNTTHYGIVEDSAHVDRLVDLEMSRHAVTKSEGAS